MAVLFEATTNPRCFCGTKAPVMTPNSVNLPLDPVGQRRCAGFWPRYSVHLGCLSHESSAHFFFANLAGACPFLCFTICFSFCLNRLSCCWVSKPLVEALPCTALFICLWSFSCSLLVSSLLLVDPTQHARRHSPCINCMVQPWSNLWMVCST